MKSIYKDWHKTFPGSGQGKQYPYLLEKIMENQTHNLGARLTKPRRINPLWQNILDYGCGKGGTIRWLKELVKVNIWGYDPGHPDYANTETLKRKYDAIYTADVMEHIEEADLEAVIKQQQSLAPVNIHIIDLTPAKKRLPDGRNAHVTLLDMDAWKWHLEAPGTHEVSDMRKWTTPDPNFQERTRLCCILRKIRTHS